MWIKVTAVHTHKVRQGVKIRYKPGVYSVPTSIGNAIIAAGDAEKAARPKSEVKPVSDGETS